MPLVDDVLPQNYQLRAMQKHTCHPRLVVKSVPTGKGGVVEGQTAKCCTVEDVHVPGSLKGALEPAAVRAFFHVVQVRGCNGCSLCRTCGMCRAQACRLIHGCALCVLFLLAFLLWAVRRCVSFAAGVAVPNFFEKGVSSILALFALAPRQLQWLSSC